MARRRAGRGTKSKALGRTPLIGATAEFVAVEMPAPPKTASRVAADSANASRSADPFILVDLRRGPLHLSVRWPRSAGDDCAAWLRELTTGLLK